MKSTMVIITGLPTTGKSHLGAKIAKELSLPYVSKDEIKELLFDQLGWSDCAWSLKLNAAAFEMMDYFILNCLKSGGAFVVESNRFETELQNHLKEWQNQYDFFCLQIICTADRGVLLDRFRQRTESGDRHPGHVDNQNYAEFEQRLQKDNIRPLNLEGDVLNIDTTDFEKVDYEKIIKTIANISGVI
jgi:predicted kinase